MQLRVIKQEWKSSQKVEQKGEDIRYEAEIVANELTEQQKKKKKRKAEDDEMNKALEQFQKYQKSSKHQSRSGKKTINFNVNELVLER